MKHILRFIAFTVIFVSCTNTVNEQIPPNAQNDYDFLITKNPNSDRPTPENLLDIKKDIRAHFKKIGKNTDNLLQWEERGPDNIGGRTRAIMFDPNDATHKKVFAGGVSGGLWYNNDITNSESSWNNINDFWTSLGVTCIAYDPNNSQVFYVGTGESSARSTRGGGLWKSTDGGDTWNNIPLSLDNGQTVSTEAYYINDLSVRNNSGISEIFFSATPKFYMEQWHSMETGGLWKSTDGGANFTKVKLESSETVTTSNIPYDIELGSDNSIWIGTVGSSYGGGPKGGKVYKSTDGTSFTKIYDVNANSGYTSQNRVEIAVAPSNPNVAYVIIADNLDYNGGKGGNIKMVKTLDGGSSWHDMPLPNDADTGIPDHDFTRGQSFYDLILQVKPDDENYLFAGGIDLFYSENAAQDPTTGTDMEWTQAAHWRGSHTYPFLHADQHEIIFNPSNYNEVIIGNDGGIYICEDLSTVISTEDRFKFENRNKDYNITQLYAGDIYKTSSLEFMVAGAQDNGTQYYVNPGMNSTFEISDGDGGFCFFDDDEEDDIVITSYVYNNYHLFTKSGTLKNSFGLGNNIGTFINPTDYDSKTNTLIGAAGTGNVSVYEITGTNVKTSTKSLKGFSSAKVSAIKISPFQLNTGKTDAFLGTQGSKILHLQDMSGLFGTTVVDISSPDFRGVVSSIDIGASTNEMLATFSNYGIESVWYTNDGGDHWESKESNLPDMPIRWGVFNKADRKNVFIATELGVWETKNITASAPIWKPANEGLANVRVNMLSTSDYDNTLIAATYGRGLFSAKLPGNVLSIDNNLLSSQFKVYPNPVVNETLYIEPSNNRNISDVKLYNTNGQLVLSKTINSVNKTDVNVSSLAQGQYILKVETDGGIFSKNILIK